MDGPSEKQLERLHQVVNSISNRAPRAVKPKKPHVTRVRNPGATAFLLGYRCNCSDCRAKRPKG